MSQRHDNRPATRTTLRGRRRHGHDSHPCMPIYLGIEQPSGGGRPPRE